MELPFASCSEFSIIIIISAPILLTATDSRTVSESLVSKVVYAASSPAGRVASPVAQFKVRRLA